LWWLIWEWLGSEISKGAALVIFWLILLPHISVAAYLANQTEKKDFYGSVGPKTTSVALMMFWNVDFISWWAMYQTILFVDQAISDLPHVAHNMGASFTASPTIIGINMVLIILQVVFSGAVTLLNVDALPKYNHRKAHHQKDGAAHPKVKDAEEPVAEIDEI